ncbi:MAG TPA: 50S ribosomal protein L4 [bacterium]|jgi:large subunit ribosomal protein L4
MSVKLNIYDIDGKVQGELSLETIPDGFKPDGTLIARSLRRQLANARAGTAHTKTRAEVSGTTGKMYRQKGTGRARHGTKKVNLWTGGGVTFGPTKERNWKLDMNKKERKAALRHIFWGKIQDGKVVLLGDSSLDKPSTKKGVGFFNAIDKKGKCLVVLPIDEKFEFIRKSFRNIPYVTVTTPDRLNTFDLLNNQNLIAHTDAFEMVRNTWGV